MKALDVSQEKENSKAPADSYTFEIKHTITGIDRQQYALYSTGPRSGTCQ